jgi:glycosyltransferase involved in cell wall biosynthesis
MMPEVRSVSIILPALNEEEAIERAIRSVPRQELVALGYDTQVVVVDNGSTDRTGELARAAGAHVVFEPRRGYGRAYKTGIAEASGDVMVFADADLTYPLEKLPEMISLMVSQRLEFITCDRLTATSGKAMHLRNRIGNGLLSLIVRLLFRVKLADSQSGMWLVRRDLLDRLDLKSDGMPFSQELKIKAIRLANAWREVPIEYRPRVGEAKLRVWRDGFENVMSLLRLRFGR